jgi:hypothetical protein
VRSISILREARDSSRYQKSIRSLTVSETDLSFNFMNMISSTNKTYILVMTDKDVNMTR